MKISKKLLLILVILILAAFTAIASGNMKKKTGNSKVKSDKASLCKGLFPNGTYTGTFEVKADGELDYYTEYLEIENGEIRIYPVFNSQTRELSFNIKNDNVKVICK
ncbi:hypothetical protein EII29_06825 [Leptotrichia sp. OH3620_COT-345]|uniref:hypothetical protein n=1 Tax=Leptotrichia sp. OH3620_COT-345 TaxID=2491048 RepID=UPI000F6517F7|nr:hypothetical protein [Leptotrichia sp. OH3620_COT-345]RRD39518.1 hypothetical protein EII29_06825 [Leptotrichia sp. OH3620_COT-345]